MEQSAEEKECGICLDALTNPVSLPCSHKFCSECLNGWRSKYGVKSGDDKIMDRKCPLCREKIPPSREMIAQLKLWQWRKSQLEGEGDVLSWDYRYAKSRIETLEDAIGDWTETIDYSDDKKCLMLPTDIFVEARENNIQKVLEWLGPLPVDKQRLNAKNPEVMNYTLVIGAVTGKNSDLLSIVLQLGADVDPVDADGDTPFSLFGSEPERYAQARLLLEWGAEISNNDRRSKDDFITMALRKGNTKIANLMKSEFGGRRCEIFNLPNRRDLIGKTCVVEKYLPDKGRYKVIFEISGEVGLVGPHNLKRRDRTPDDCGYYISYKNGSTARHEFASKEECQAFLSSLDEGEKSGDGDDAAVDAEEAAASLLAELSIESSADSNMKSKKKGKQKKGKGKKGRK